LSEEDFQEKQALEKLLGVLRGKDIVGWVEDLGQAAEISYVALMFSYGDVDEERSRE